VTRTFWETILEKEVVRSRQNSGEIAYVPTGAASKRNRSGVLPDRDSDCRLTKQVRYALHHCAGRV
jgi:hypothetical protein